VADWGPFGGGEGMLLLERDLLDQQIIDVHGRKVVRVNDVDIHEERGNGHIVLKVGAVDVGPRGAIRRLLKGVVPAAALHLLLERIPPRMIPWEFVDLIEIDPARRVKLKISLDRLPSCTPPILPTLLRTLLRLSARPYLRRSMKRLRPRPWRRSIPSCKCRF